MPDFMQMTSMELLNVKIKEKSSFSGKKSVVKQTAYAAGVKWLVNQNINCFSSLKATRSMVNSFDLLVLIDLQSSEDVKEIFGDIWATRS